MVRLVRIGLLMLAMAMLAGCAHVISKDLRQRAEPAVAFDQVFNNPEAFKGKWVVWGGEIVQTINQKDGTTLVEVFQRPLTWREEPVETLASGGRFLVQSEKVLDPYVFRRGRKITVAGEIQGGRQRPLGEMDYRYPALLSRQIHLWPEYVYAYAPYPYPYYYDPWWYGPGWWRFNFYYHHR
jgi:outer membrane lipoprotein